MKKEISNEEIIKKIKKSKYKYEKEYWTSYLLAQNQKLIYKAARRYVNIHNNIEDLKQDAIRGFIHSIKVYNPKKAKHFSTCATIWMRAYILRNINKYSMIYEPICKMTNKKLEFNIVNNPVYSLDRMFQLHGPYTVDETQWLIKDNNKKLEYTDNIYKEEFDDELKRLLLKILTKKELNILIKWRGLFGHKKTISANGKNNAKLNMIMHKIKANKHLLKKILSWLGDLE